jgi:type II secretory pathway pseudopilin PulG
MSSRFSPLSNSRSGFGLIELMVSISIMMLVAGVILIKQSSFNGATLLRSQAYEIALTAREVQTAAVSASAIQGSTREMLGLRFDTSRNTTYRIFRDDEGNGSYESSEEFGQQNSLDSRFEIKAIRVGVTSQNNLSVMFERPNFDAKFYVGSTQVSASQVEIDVGTKDNSSAGVKTVVITATAKLR